MSLFPQRTDDDDADEDPGLTAGERFEQFHQANPHIYDKLVDMTFDLSRRGRRRIGIKMLFEVLRWQHYTTSEDPDSEFVLNNSYTSRYARRIMAEYPELDGMFELRRLHTR